MTVSLLDMDRDRVKAYAQAGILNIQSLLHWDICNHLAKGNTIEKTADDFRVKPETVQYIKSKKCRNCS